MNILDEAFRVDSSLPDFSERDDVRPLVPYELVSPIASLLHSRDEILGANSIDALNHKKALEQLLKNIASIERALYVRWNDL